MVDDIVVLTTSLDVRQPQYVNLLDLELRATGGLVARPASNPAERLISVFPVSTFSEATTIGGDGSVFLGRCRKPFVENGTPYQHDL